MGYEIRKKIPNATLDAVSLLMAYYLATDRPVYVVQIGACDGRACDSLYPFLRHGKIRALLIEPIPRSFAKLQTTYMAVPNMTLVQAAIARDDGTVTMYGVKSTSQWRPPDEGMLFSSLLKSHLLHCGVPPADIEEIVVPSYSLQTLCSKFVPAAIDLLQIDVEGYDEEVLGMALALPTLPKCIGFEKKHLSTGSMKEIFSSLQERGYLFIHDEMNSLAVQREVETGWSEL